MPRSSTWSQRPSTQPPRASAGSIVRPMTRSPQLRLTLLALVFAVLAAFPAAAMAKRGDVKVMSRNVYLGADLGPGTSATSLQELVNAAGVILNEVDTNDFSV